MSLKQTLINHGFYPTRNVTKSYLYWMVYRDLKRYSEVKWVLDVGCGEMTLRPWLKSKFCKGIDPNFPSLYRRLSFVRHKISIQDFRSKPCNLVLCVQLLNANIEPWETTSVVKKLTDLTAPGGTLLFNMSMRHFCWRLEVEKMLYKNFGHVDVVKYGVRWGRNTVLAPLLGVLFFRLFPKNSMPNWHKIYYRCLGKKDGQ